MQFRYLAGYFYTIRPDTRYCLYKVQALFSGLKKFDMLKKVGMFIIIIYILLEMIIKNLAVLSCLFTNVETWILPLKFVGKAFANVQVYRC
jgi:hypothetical protein